MDKSKWEYKKLCDVALIIMGQSPSSDSYNEEGKGLPFFQGNADFGVLHPKARVYCDAPQREANENDILMSVRAPIGAINIANTHCCIGRGLCAISPKERVLELKYLYYFLISKNGYLNQQGTGSTFKSISKKIIFDLSIPVPSLASQQRIAGEIDCLNEMIALKQEQLKEFDKLAQSIFYDMFGEGYETKDLGDFCEVGTGATPDRKKEAIYYGGNTNWVKTTEVQNSDIYETEESITEIALEQTNCKVYPSGTILMAMYGQGKTRGQVARLMIKAATNQACAAIIPDTKVCDKDYLYVYLLLSYEKIRNMARGGNQANLNLGLVKKISVPLPPLALQQQFAEKIQAIEAQKELVKKSIAETQQLLDSRMDYYFD